MSTYTIEKRGSGSYAILDEDGERVCRVAAFRLSSTTQHVLVEGLTIMPPEMARVVAKAMQRCARDIEREAVAA